MNPHTTPTLALSACLVGILLGSPAMAQDASMPCDPWTTVSSVPAPSGRTCGNGRIDSYPSDCERVCGGGCGRPQSCSVRCGESTEMCDGGDFGTRTCAHYGYSGGALHCSRTCDWVDARGCDPCFAGPGVTCGQVSLRGLRDAGAPLLAPRGAEMGMLVPASTATTRNGFFFAELDANLTLHGRLRPVGGSDADVTGFAATSEGYLVALDRRGAGRIHGVQLRLIRPGRRGPFAPVVWEREAAETLLSQLMTTDRGEPVLELVQGYPPRRTLHFLDARGNLLPLPDRTVHAVGRGRRLAIPVGVGRIAVPEGSWAWPQGSSSVETRAGDHVNIEIDWQCGSPNGCSVSFGVQRAGRIIGSFGGVRRGERLVDMPLPGGSHVVIIQEGSEYRDVVRGPSPLDSVSPSRLLPPTLRVFGGGVSERFIRTPDGALGVATIVEPFVSDADEVSLPDDRRPRVYLARIRL